MIVVSRNLPTTKGPQRTHSRHLWMKSEVEEARTEVWFLDAMQTLRKVERVSVVQHLTVSFAGRS